MGRRLSLGTQALIKDFIGGILIWVEGSCPVGEVIKVADISGRVERITPRATYRRDVEGKLSLIPNDEIRIMSNMTHGQERQCRFEGQLRSQHDQS